MQGEQQCTNIAITYGNVRVNLSNFHIVVITTLQSTENNAAYIGGEKEIMND